MDEIRITCEGFTTHDLEAFIDLQGNLKELTTENYEKGRTSILRYGFSFPMFAWVNEDKIYTLDGHQRLRILTKLKKEGFMIPPLPTDYIHAKNMIEAKEKLLLQNSPYGTMTNEGYYEFIHDPIAPIFADNIEPMLVLPFQVNPTFGQEPEAGLPDGPPQEAVCPKCGEKFTLTKPEK